jgi:hypothetical protein
MPDMTPLGNTGVVPPPNQGLSTLSSILGIQHQRQALQTGQYTQEAAQATSEQADQKNKELQAVGNLTKGVYASGRYKNDDGSFDNTKFANDVAQVAPTYGQGIANDATARAGELYKNQQTLFNLDTSQRKVIGDMFGALAAKVDPKTGQPSATHSDYIDAIEQLREQYPNNKSFSRMLTSAGMSIPVEAQGTQLQQIGRQFAQSVSSPTAAQTDPNVSTMQSPGGLQPVQMNPQAPGGIGPRGQPMKQGVAPGMTSLPGGNVGVVGSAGTVRPATEVGGQVTPEAPPGKLQPLKRPGINAPAADQASYQARIKGAGEEYDAVRGAANNPQNGVQVNRYRNQQILDLTKIAPTGPGKDVWNHFASQFGGESGDAFQKIGHYLAQNSASLAKSMGVPNTNMGSETAAASGGNTAQNPNAIKEITKVNDALNSAFDLYNRGLAKVTNNGSDFAKAAAYKQAFGETLDVNALRWADAHRRGDKDEIADLKKKFGDKEIAGFQKKLGTLKALATTGDLP